jgi:hypothetical protein
VTKHLFPNQARFTEPDTPQHCLAVVQDRDICPGYFGQFATPEHETCGYTLRRCRPAPPALTGAARGATQPTPPKCLRRSLVQKYLHWVAKPPTSDMADSRSSSMSDLQRSGCSGHSADVLRSPKRLSRREITRFDGLTNHDREDDVTND